MGENQMVFVDVNMSFAFLMTLQQIENDLSIWGGKKMKRSRLIKSQTWKQEETQRSKDSEHQKLHHTQFRTRV